VKGFIHIHTPKAAGSGVDEFFKFAFPDKLINSSHGSLATEVHETWVAWKEGIGPLGDGHPMWAVDNEINAKFRTKQEVHTITPIPRGAFSTAIKFSTCRNPYDWLVSYYHCHPEGFGGIRTIHGTRTFEEFVEKFCDPDFKWYHYGLHKFLFYQMFREDGSCGVNWILRAEDIWHAMLCMLYTEGEDEDYLLSSYEKFGGHRRNVSPTREHSDYRLYYTDTMRELVENRFHLECSLYGYDFDGPTDDSPFVKPPIENLRDILVWKKELTNQWAKGRIGTYKKTDGTILTAINMESVLE